MTKDFIPRADGELLVWLNNFSTNIATQGTVLGLSATQITSLQTNCSTTASAIQNAEAKKLEAANAISAKDTAKASNLAAIRQGVTGFKTASAYTNAIGESLGVVGSVSTLDEAAYKPVINGSLFAGFVRIKFAKNGVDGVNIYHRKKGALAWQFLARDTKSPYDDHIELATTGQPEHWEYRAYGVVDDAEIGLPSDIVEIVFGG